MKRCSRWKDHGNELFVKTCTKGFLVWRGLLLFQGSCRSIHPLAKLFQPYFTRKRAQIKVFSNMSLQISNMIYAYSIREKHAMNITAKWSSERSSRAFIWLVTFKHVRTCIGHLIAANVFQFRHFLEGGGGDGVVRRVFVFVAAGEFSVMFLHRLAAERIQLLIWF